MDLRTAHTRIADDNVPADELYTTVVRRGRRQRRARIVLRATMVAAVVAVGGLAVATAGDDPTATTGPADAPPVVEPTTTTTEAVVHATSTTEEVPEGDGPSGWVTLRAPDWQESVDADRASVAGGAPFVVRGADGRVLSTGNVGTYGEAIFHQPLGTFTISVDLLVDGSSCGFSATVTLETDGQEVLLDLRCG